MSRTIRTQHCENSRLRFSDLRYENWRTPFLCCYIVFEFAAHFSKTSINFRQNTRGYKESGWHSLCTNQSTGWTTKESSFDIRQEQPIYHLASKPTDRLCRNHKACIKGAAGFKNECRFTTSLPYTFRAYTGTILPLP
jgi:hypothetical protein